MRGIVIAGTHSGCGKTTVTLGILAALTKKGLTVQPFKTGPDFIDAGLHRLVAERPSRNLDQWMCGPEYVIECFNRYSTRADISVIEGVMGMYDGDFSTADLARLLQAPVILVVDGYGMAESAGAVVKGFVDFGMRISDCGNNPPNPPLKRGCKGGLITGVIFNRVASESHYKRLKDSVRDVPVLGYLPRELNFEIPHRHLGLTTAEESPITRENVDRLADTVLQCIDIDRLITPEDCIIAESEKKEAYGKNNSALRIPHSALRIAVAYDKAFSFYYEDNFDLLREAGAEIVFFSPLSDRNVPNDVDAVYIGGGYPEIHARELSANRSMLESLRAWSDVGKPLYAECGGLMYLSKGLQDFEGKLFKMVGVFPFETRMTKKPRLGYREIVFEEDCILGTKGATCRGHEFHYSEIVDSPKVIQAYSIRDRQSRACGTEGHRYKNSLASYIHVHFGSNLNIAACFAGFIKGERTA